MITHAGLVATPSPGSVFAYAAETPRGSYFGNFLGIVVAAAVSFAVGSILLGFGRFAEPRHVGRHADHSDDYRMIDAGLAPAPAPAPVRAPAPAPTRAAGPRPDWRA
jgi:mannitol PTS system EIICBA or EIICB component